MRTVIVVLIAVLALGAAAVYAGPPQNGTWSSSSGAFDEGTATSSWAGGDFLSASNVFYGRSAVGGVFTNDWIFGCPVVVSVTPLGPPLGANGNFTYMLTYAGGYVTLGGPGNPWDGGDASYTGALDSYVEIRTISTAGDLIVGAVSDHALSATIQGYPNSCVAWAIGNGVLRGGTPPGAPKAFNYGVLQSVKGAGYPDYPDAACVLNPSGPGHWDDIRDLTLSIAGCTLATEKSTWGNVKAMYRN